MVTRVASLQSRSTGCDKHLRGRTWAQSLCVLGADIGGIAKTSLNTDSHYCAAVSRMQEDGYTAISHGAARDRATHVMNTQTPAYAREGYSSR
jgi:hypothetical protein